MENEEVVEKINECQILVEQAQNLLLECEDNLDYQGEVNDLKSDFESLWIKLQSFS